MVSFVVTLVNTENSGLTEEELETIEQQTLIAANLWGRHFDAPGVVIEIEVDVASDRTAAGSQSSVFVETLESGANVFQTGVAYELATGIDPNGDLPDIRVQLREEDVAQTFFLETEPDTRTGDIPLGQQDFISIMLHELGHGFGFGGFVGGGPISDVFDATTLGVFDTFFEEVEGGFVFNGENVVRVAGRPLELNEELSRGFLSHFGNLPATFQGFSAYPGFGDDLGAMVMAGFFFLRDVRYYITAADIAVLEDVGVPIRRPSESDDLLYGYEVPDPGIEANYGVPNASFLSGNDSIDALDGDDTIYGFSGADTLKGGSGADLLEGGAGADLLDGGTGLDIASYADSTEAVQVNLAVGSVTGGDATGDEYVSIEGVQGSAFADALTGDAAANSLLGLAGNDTLSGGRGVDTLDGGEGNDILLGGTQADRLDGGAGSDSLLGGNGNDTVEGGSGSDTLSGSIGDDSLNGGSQGDRLFGDSGADTLNGGGGSDRVDYLIGDDAILVDLETGEATGGFA
ncbi:MAG: hypothetical protein JJ850_15960, partial [Kordiimonadaceae bacterium]|nr:hypothetical protein [Kordiimonadaceae bacterium]